MNTQIAFALIHKATGPFAPRSATQRGHGLRMRLSKAIDELVLGLAVMGPPDNSALDTEYAEAMVGVFDEWFALKGLKAGKGGLR